MLAIMCYIINYMHLDHRKYSFTIFKNIPLIPFSYSFALSPPHLSTYLVGSIVRGQ